jgi:KRAB domain-containing zinc finger protein
MPIKAPFILILRMRRRWLSVKCVVKLNAYIRSLLLQMTAHTGASVCICDICYKSLTDKEHLKFHCRTHTGENPSVFDVCGKAFSKCSLKLNQRTHTSERTYICKVCNKSFVQRSTHVIHKRYHGAETLCHLNNKGFLCKALLNFHQKSCAV